MCSPFTKKSKKKGCDWLWFLIHSMGGNNTIELRSAVEPRIMKGRVRPPFLDSPLLFLNLFWWNGLVMNYFEQLSLRLKNHIKHLHWPNLPTKTLIDSPPTWLSFNKILLPSMNIYQQESVLHYLKGII